LVSTTGWCGEAAALGPSQQSLRKTHTSATRLRWKNKRVDTMAMPPQRMV
jgi:hypothetical protein